MSIFRLDQSVRKMIVIGQCINPHKIVGRNICSGLSWTIRPKLMTESIQSSSKRFRSYKSKEPHHYRPAMLDDLPIPKGSWQASYKKKQAKYNRHLIIGLSFWLFTVWFITQSGYLFFNFYPPPLPELDEDADLLVCIKPPTKQKADKED